MWDALIRPVAEPPKPRGRGVPTGINKTAMLRNHMQDAPRTTKELAAHIGSTSSAVWPLLKRDIQLGRVRLIGGMYYLVSNVDHQLPGRIQAAAKLLQEHGWSVVPPDTGGPHG